MTDAKHQALLAEAQHVVALGLDLRDLATLVLLANQLGRGALTPGETLARMVTCEARSVALRPVLDYDHARAVLATHTADEASGRGCSCGFDHATGQLLTAPECPVHGKRPGSQES